MIANPGHCPDRTGHLSDTLQQKQGQVVRVHGLRWEATSGSLVLSKCVCMGVCKEDWGWLRRRSDCLVLFGMSRVCVFPVCVCVCVCFPELFITHTELSEGAAGLTRLQITCCKGGSNLFG